MPNEHTESAMSAERGVASSSGTGHDAACPKVNPARFGEPCSLLAGHEGECVPAPEPAEFKRHYTQVCHCEWEDDDGWTRSTTSEHCVIHGNVPDPLDALLAERQQDAKRIERLETALEQIVSAGSERAALSDAATASDNPIVRREATRIRSAFVTAVDDARAALAGEEDAPARVRPNETREIVYECRGVALPERIAVDQAGTYWRDLGPFLSLVPHKHGNENATIVAEYRLTITPGMKLRAAVEEDTTP